MSPSLLRTSVPNTLKQSIRWLNTKSRSNFPHRQPHTNSPPPVQPPSRTLVALSAVAATSIAAYTTGSIYPPSTLSLLFPRAAPAPLDPNTPEANIYTSSLEQSLQSLPLLSSLRKKSDANDWYEVRPYQNFPEERRVNSLTAGALRGPGKLALNPLVRAKKDESESYVFLHVGRGLCGHDGIIHGGLLATLLDETLGRTAISNLPERVGVTAQLQLNYRAPTRADQFIIIRTFVEEVNGRKVRVKGLVEDLEGNILVEAQAMFVQPRYAKLLNAESLHQAMGEPPKSHAPVLLADGEKLKTEKDRTIDY
ncbi:hypothetical protein Hypma_004371 [Hypsizygus marmoreus]|uniref:Thioesterase domain-containing protein n=1 Tax=Hypsizygus marmoreus TaxID=39966 RepID=A0A369K8P7_HYPMA|nr:hypothetical protein Hypma_004371 [Hypsizygus marmoreus]